jgi:hypothetical protein
MPRDEKPACCSSVVGTRQRASGHDAARLRADGARTGHRRTAARSSETRSEVTAPPVAPPRLSRGLWDRGAPIARPAVARNPGAERARPRASGVLSGRRVRGLGQSAAHPAIRAIAPAAVRTSRRSRSADGRRPSPVAGCPRSNDRASGGASDTQGWGGLAGRGSSRGWSCHRRESRRRL